MGKTSLPIVSLTPSAIKQVEQIRISENIPEDHALRIGVKGGGCSGFSYVLGFDKQEEADDVVEISGIKVLMNKAHALHLLGIEIDWLEGLNSRGFVFNNPNAKDTCGCGTSFSV